MDIEEAVNEEMLKVITDRDYRRKMGKGFTPTFQYVSLFVETQQPQLYFQIMSSLYVGENWKNAINL